MAISIMNYHLRVYDNYHYMDESEAYNHGEYSSYKEATIAAQGIVREFMEHNFTKGMTPDDLLAQFALYGDDPVIMPNEHGENKRFSARKYAKGIVESICKK